jgi:hypothetical protein
MYVAYKPKGGQIMTTEELLRKRYKVVALYPDSPFVAGQVLELSLDDYNVWGYFHFTDDISDNYTDEYLSSYPHLFEPLPWWKDRKVEDMPEFLKWTDTGVVCKYHRHEGAYFYLEDDNCFRYALVNTIPATKEEYEAYLKNTNQLKDGQ